MLLGISCYNGISLEKFYDVADSYCALQVAAIMTNDPMLSRHNTAESKVEALMSIYIDPADYDRINNPNEQYAKSFIKTICRKVHRLKAIRVLRSERNDHKNLLDKYTTFLKLLVVKEKLRQLVFMEEDLYISIQFEKGLLRQCEIARREGNEDCRPSEFSINNCKNEARKKVKEFKEKYLNWMEFQSYVKDNADLIFNSKYCQYH